jgi:hypothetical protein
MVAHVFRSGQRLTTKSAILTSMPHMQRFRLETCFVRHMQQFNSFLFCPFAAPVIPGCRFHIRVPSWGVFAYRIKKVYSSVLAPKTAVCPRDFSLFRPPNDRTYNLYVQKYKFESRTRGGDFSPQSQARTVPKRPFSSSHPVSPASKLARSTIIA